MKNVLKNTNLVIKVLQNCNMKCLINLSRVSKQNNSDFFLIIDEYIWKSHCITNYGGHLQLSWYDLYSALSNENKLKQKYFELRKNYIEVANCCKCRLYCNVCSFPITNTEDIQMTCPNCRDTFTINDFETTYNQIDDVSKRGSVTYVCNDCKLFK